jgi:Homeodomain
VVESDAPRLQARRVAFAPARIKPLCDRFSLRFMAPISANLFRSESSSSLGSSSSADADEPIFSSPPNPTTKRSRKRFTGSQLTMLEQLFHRTSHPSREERETLARDLDLYAPFLLLLFVFVD